MLQSGPYAYASALLLLVCVATGCSTSEVPSPSQSLRAGMDGSALSAEGSSDRLQRAPGAGGSAGSADDVWAPTSGAGETAGRDDDPIVEGGTFEGGLGGAKTTAGFERGGDTSLGGRNSDCVDDGGFAGWAEPLGANGSVNSGGRNVGGSASKSVDAEPPPSFAVLSSSPSSAIPTVGVVEWSTSLDHLEGASIDWNLVDPKQPELNRSGSAPVDLRKPNYRTLLLGLKPRRSYRYHIVARSGGQHYTSDDYPLTTGPADDDLPIVGRQVQRDGARARGFIVTSQGLGGSPTKNETFAFIVDSDGDLVWWMPAPPTCSRALMSYDGTEMWMVALNNGAGGEVRRVSMDGLDVTRNVSGLSGAHHDITVLPGGIVAALGWSKADDPSYIIERSQDGSTKKVVTLDNRAYLPSGKFHANSIHYWASEDAYTVSDRYGSLFVKIKRSGDVLWQFGGDCSNAPARKCVSGDWNSNHGHHLLGDGTLLFFSNGPGNTTATIFEYKLTESGNNLFATQNWSYSDDDRGSTVFGDAQRLPNGNTLITFSTDGVIEEIDPNRSLVQRMWTDSLGYADFRETLYGAPMRK